MIHVLNCVAISVYVSKCRIWMYLHEYAHILKPGIYHRMALFVHLTWICVLLYLMLSACKYGVQQNEKVCCQPKKVQLLCGMIQNNKECLCFSNIILLYQSHIVHHIRQSTDHIFGSLCVFLNYRNDLQSSTINNDNTNQCVISSYFMIHELKNYQDIRKEKS